MEPIDFIAYGFLPWYPHMATADTEIWNRYIRAYPKRFSAVAYDVAVGASAEFDVTAGGVLGPGIKRLYQRRIDVVAQDEQGVVLIELKPRASTGAIGQLQGYVTLFERDYPQFAPVRPLIITDSLMPEMQFLADKANIKVEVV